MIASDAQHFSSDFFFTGVIGGDIILPMDVKTRLASFHFYLYTNLVQSLVDLSEEQLAYSAPLIDERTLREVALHTYRPVLATACVACGKHWPARVPLPTAKEAFLDLLQNMRDQIDALIEHLPSNAFELTISLPWNENQDILDAFHQSIGHGLLHIGQIYGIRAFGGFPLPAEESKPQRGK